VRTGDPGTGLKRNHNYMEIAPRASRPQRAPRAIPALAACLGLLALPAAGCGSDDDADDKPAKSGGAGATAAKDAVTVKIASFKFKPDPVKVKAGGTITFVNQDKAPHTAQTDLNPKTAEFDSGRLATGDQKAVELAKSGKFEYFCVYHRFMEGTVEVVQ